MVNNEPQVYFCYIMNVSCTKWRYCGQTPETCLMV